MLAKTGLIYSILILISSINIADEDNWKLKKEEDGIKVYTRDEKDSKLKELKITTNLNTTLPNLVATISDKNHLKNWVYKCTESSLLKQVSEFESYHYQRTDTPWPLEDRDLILHSKIVQDPDSKIVEIHAEGIGDYIKEKKDAVRIHYYKANWKIIPENDRKVTIIYTVSFDPGGNIPLWIVNLGVTEGPFQTIKNLKKELLTNTNKKANFIIQ